MIVFSKLSRIAGAFAVAGFLFVGSASSAHARPGGLEGPPRGNPVERFTERLQLTTDQQAKIKTIFEQHFAAHKGERTKIEGPSEQERAAFRQKMETERAALDKEIKAILTPAQQLELDKIKAAMKEGRGHGPGAQDGLEGPPPGNPADFFSQRLQLTGEQKAQLEALFKQRAAARRAERETREAQMTPEQKAEREARRKERMAQMEAEHTALDNEIRAVLTPQQQAEFEKMKAERKERRGPGPRRGGHPQG